MKSVSAPASESYPHTTSTPCVKEVRKELAEFFGRTYSAIGFKEREVIGVLTEGQEGIYTYGDNMVTATMEALEESGLSKSRFRMWFE